MSQLLAGHIDILLKRQREGRCSVEADEGDLARVEELDASPHVPLVAVKEEVRAGKYDRNSFSELRTPAKNDNAASKDSAVAVVAPSSSTATTSSPVHATASDASTSTSISSSQADAVVSAASSTLPVEMLSEVILGQAFDGSWALDEKFARSVRRTLADLEAKRPQSISAAVCATAVAVAVLRKYFAAFEVEWRLLVQKAIQFLSSQGANTEELFTLVNEML